MPEKITSWSFRLLFVLTVCAGLVCAATTVANAQFAPGEIRQVERDNSVREREIDREKRRPKRDPNEVMAEVNDDLRQLNELNAIAMHIAATNQTLKYNLIVSHAMEIKKRSTS